MQFNDRFTVDAETHRTWQFMLNVPEVLRCLPGCDEVAQVGNGTYQATMTQRVGPFRVSFRVTADVEVSEQERRIQAKGKGKDARLGNTLDFSMDLRVAEADEGSLVELDTRVDIRGPLAQLGMPLMNHKAKETFTQFARNVQGVLSGA